MKIRNLITATAVLALVAPCAAEAQDVVMRRPLPKEAKGGTTPGTTDPTPDDPTNDDPTIRTVSNETPKGFVGTPNQVADPATSICDANSTSVTLTDVQWQEAGWTTPAPSKDTCTTQTQNYTCRATYTCDVGGRKSTFVSEAPDATCENFTGPVQYVQGSYPNENYDQTAAWVARQMRAMAVTNGRPTTDDGRAMRQGQSAIGAAGLMATGMFSRVISGTNYWVRDESGGGWANDWLVIAQFRVGWSDADVTMRGNMCGAMNKQGFPCESYGFSSEYIKIKP